MESKRYPRWRSAMTYSSSTASPSTFGMTGWRLGWLVAPQRYVREIEKLAQNLYIAPSTVAQHAALAAFRPETMAILEARRRSFAPPGYASTWPAQAWFQDRGRAARRLLCVCRQQRTGRRQFRAWRGTAWPTPAWRPRRASTSAAMHRSHMRFAYTIGRDRIEEGMVRMAGFWIPGSGIPGYRPGPKELGTLPAGNSALPPRSGITRRSRLRADEKRKRVLN
jgi:hypothetical protein